jgi:peptidoglycan/LPS O-acetylase OafA/YrhL
MKRSLHLDVIRGIAILMVLGTHFRIAVPAEGAVRWFAEFWNERGELGVPVFFVLSGYLIGGLLIAEVQKHGSVNIPRFLVRRGFKIYPSYYVFIGYLMVTAAIRLADKGEAISSIPATILHNFWPTLLFVQNLAVEEHFYILLPFLVVYLCHKDRVRYLVHICLWSPVYFTCIRLLCAWFGDPYITNLQRTVVATHLHLDGLLFGVGLRALSVYYPESFARLLRPKWIFLSIAGLIILFLPNQPFWGLPFHRIIPFKQAASGLIFLGLLDMKAPALPVARHWVTLAARGLAFIGTYSYCIYIWHVTVMGMLTREAVGRLQIDTTIPFFWCIGAAILCAGAIVAGIIISILVEIPTLRLRERLFPSRS